MRQAVPGLTKPGVDTLSKSRERGQAAVFLILCLGFFLIGGIGFVVDGGNVWFHRQTAQTAADAACTAGAMDMLSVAASANLPTSSWTNSANSYASLNGYKSSAVTITFPDTVTGVLPSSDCDYAANHSVCAATDLVSQPYMSVSVKDPVSTTFMRFVGAGPVNVPARSTCGLTNVLSPVPVLVLNPNAPNGVDVNGVAITKILKSSGQLSVFGALRNIQVNSTDGNAVDFSVTPSLSNAFGDGNGEFAIAGRESANDAGVDSSVKWVNAAGVMSDPLAIIPPPPTPGRDCSTGCVWYGAPPGTPGCPLNVSCDLYQPGYYPPISPTPAYPISCPGSLGNQAAICVGRHLVDGNQTGLAVFEPGIYYLAEDFYAGPNSCVRSVTGAGNGGGSIFYLSGLSVLNVTAASGALTSGAFDCATTPVSIDEAKCPNGNLNLPTSVTGFTGNVLLAPCTGPYGDRTGAGDRGILFFHDRDVQPAQPRWLESGPFALVGDIYLHYCNSKSSPPGTGSGADCAPDAFTETLTLGGGGPNAYIVGGVVVDQLEIDPGAQVNIALDTSRRYYVLKASLLQ